MQESCESNRVAVYIDGNNLSRAILDAHWYEVMWVDLTRLSHELCERLPGNHHLRAIKYFTARPCGKQTCIDPPKADPEVFEKYVAANQNSDILETIRGKSVHRNGWHVEKRTDVNLAFHITADAYDEAFETAIVVSGDTDFVNLMISLIRKFPKKLFAIASPPVRINQLARELEDERAQHIRITEPMLRSSLLPTTVQHPKTRKPIVAPPLSYWVGSTAS